MGAGGLLALALTIIGDIVALKDRAKFQGYFMSVFGISSVLGPVVGGAFAGSENILGFDGWRWVFFINLPIGLAALAVVFLYLHLPAKHVKQKIDYWGAAAITLAIVPLLLVAEQGRSWGWTSASSLLCIGLGMVGIIAFLLAEKRAGDYALIPLRLFRNLTFGLSSLLNFIIGIGMFGAIAMLPMYLQLVKGLTPTEAGLMMITFTVGILTGSITAGRTISSSGTFRIFPIMGTAVLTAAALVMGFSLGVDTGLWVPGVIAVFFGLGLGFCMQPLTLAMQVSVPPKDMGVGTSSAAFFRSMGGAVGTAVFISMLFSLAADRIATGMKDAMQNADYLKVLKDPAMAADPANAKLYEFFRNGASNDSLNDTSWLHTANPVLTRPITEGFAQSIDAVMLTAAVLTGIAFLISFALPNKKLTDPKAVSKESVPAH
jgi:predicted MFS family arabinose efflux permease